MEKGRVIYTFYGSPVAQMVQNVFRWVRRAPTRL